MQSSADRLPLQEVQVLHPEEEAAALQEEVQALQSELRAEHRLPGHLRPGSSAR